MGEIRPNKRHRSEFLHIRTLRGMSLQDQADFSWADLRRFFKVTLWDGDRTCPGCNREIEKFEDATLDHIIPRSKGGRTRLANLRLMHKRCNSRKGSKITVRLPGHRFLKALQPVNSLRGTVTKYEMKRLAVRHAD